MERDGRVVFVGLMSRYGQRRTRGVVGRLITGKSVKRGVIPHPSDHLSLGTPRTSSPLVVRHNVFPGGLGRLEWSSKYVLTPRLPKDGPHGPDSRGDPGVSGVTGPCRLRRKGNGKGTKSKVIKNVGYNTFILIRRVFLAIVSGCN